MERPKSCGQLAYNYGFGNIILFSEKLKMGLPKKGIHIALPVA